MTTAKPRIDNDNNMSKLSPGLKALVNAPFARGGPSPAPSKIRDVYAAIAKDATKRNLGAKPWVTISAATTFTLNSPDSLAALQSVAGEATSDAVRSAELIREVGLKCISFNGIPRSINCLNAFHASLPDSVTSKLETKSTRGPSPENLGAATARGRELWDSVYRPFENKLYSKLGTSHPDLPVHILNGHYTTLLSNPEQRGNLANVGRILTSVVAISCLRAQTGVGPQVLSHVFGLRKALDDGTYKADNLSEEEEQAARWLATDDGSEWILNTVDTIAKALGGGNFAPTREAKL